MSTSDTHAAGAPKPSLTPDQRRTWTFVGIAAACLAITGIVEWASRPAAIAEYGRVGEDFYPDFTDPTRATALEVFAFDPEKAQQITFEVRRLANGRWVIPSHHDYPADAEEQLAKTAASIIGIRRGAMVTRWEADHARYGVVDPQQEKLSVGDVEGVGKRITLRGEDDSVLADYIIGKKTDEQGDQYYVRHPKEDEVYIAKLNIDLSTKFADWIKTDLLELDSWDVREVTVNDYSFDELQGQITNREVTTLERKTSSDPWTMEGLNDETEEVNEDAMRDTVNTIGDLKIVGVRPKQQGLTPDLKLDREAVRSQRDVDRLQSDLLTRGFALDGNADNLRLIAREGELYAATDKGLFYRLHFGRAFAGSQEELEIGFDSADNKGAEGEGEGEGEAEKKASADAGTDSSAKPEEAPKADAEAEAKEDTAGSEESKNKDDKPGRYLFVRVEFDKKYLGDEPVKPVEPEEPAELKEAAAKEAASGDEAKKDAATDEEKKSEGEEAAKEEEPKEDPLAQIRQDYEAAKLKYDTDLRDYESKLEEYNKKVEDGKKKAEELNRRFAEWYYVISGESFDKLRLTRADLVKEKEKPKEEAEGETAEPKEDGAAVEPEMTDQPEGEEPATPSPTDEAKESPKDDAAESPKEELPKVEPKENAKEATEPPDSGSKTPPPGTSGDEPGK